MEYLRGKHTLMHKYTANFYKINRLPENKQSLKSVSIIPALTSSELVIRFFRGKLPPVMTMMMMVMMMVMMMMMKMMNVESFYLIMNYCKCLSFFCHRRCFPSVIDHDRSSFWSAKFCMICELLLSFGQNVNHKCMQEKIHCTDHLRHH